MTLKILNLLLQLIDARAVALERFDLGSLGADLVFRERHPLLVGHGAIDHVVGGYLDRLRLVTLCRLRRFTGRRASDPPDTGKNECPAERIHRDPLALSGNRVAIEIIAH